jgi:hypothetical protein
MPEAASRDNAMKLLARQFEIVLEVTGLKLCLTTITLAG